MKNVGIRKGFTYPVKIMKENKSDILNEILLVQLVKVWSDKIGRLDELIRNSICEFLTHFSTE